MHWLTRSSSPRARIIFGLLAVAAATVATMDIAIAQRGPARVIVAPVERKATVETQPVIGRLVASTEADVAARIAGIVGTVSVDVGDSVTAGALIVQLDTLRLELEERSAQTAKDVAMAGVAVAEQRLKLAAAAFERQEQLRSSNAFSRSRFEDAQLAAEEARAQLRRSEAEVARTEAQLAEVSYRVRHARVEAPFDGVVTAREVQPGEYLTVGSTVVRLLDVTRLEVEVDVPSPLVDGLAPGRTLTARFEGGEPFPIVLRAIIPVQDIATRTRPARFSADVSALDQSRVADGEAVIVDIPARAADPVLTVPKDALVQRGSGWIVYAVREGQATPVDVEVGVSIGDRVAATGALQDGDRVVVRGNERLRPGQPIEGVEVDVSAAAQAGRG